MVESKDTGLDPRMKATRKKKQQLTIIGTAMVKSEDVGLSARCVGSKEMKIHNNQSAVEGHLQWINYWPGGYA